ncbi:MAG: PfkB family carbohydrate kinase [Planctomycetota bacterium]
MPAASLVPDFSSLRVAVVGDLVADHYVFGRPTRLSREAPVMVLRHESEALGTGGAANAARNVRALGARTLLLGAVGADANGRELRRILEEAGVEVEDVRPVRGWMTPTKTRILGADAGRTRHQVLRIDREPDEPASAAVREAVAARLAALAGQVDAVLVSDYGYGLVGEEVARAAALVRAAGAPVVLDPRACLAPFREATAMTPNLGELAAATGRSPDDLASAEAVAGAAAELRAAYRPRHLLVTLGNRGMALYSDEHPRGLAIRPAGPRDVVDVSGAGDTAAAVFTLALAAGLKAPAAMRLANAAAGVVVMETGAAVCPPDRLRSALPLSPLPERVAAPVAG